MDIVEDTTCLELLLYVEDRKSHDLCCCLDIYCYSSDL